MASGAGQPPAAGGGEATEGGVIAAHDQSEGAQASITIAPLEAAEGGTLEDSGGAADTADEEAAPAAEETNTPHTGTGGLADGRGADGASRAALLGLAALAGAVSLYSVARLALRRR